MSIKIKYNSGLLSSDTIVIDKPDIIMEVQSDVELNGFLLLELSNKYTITVNIIKTNSGYNYRGRLRLFQQNLPYLNKPATLKLYLVNSISKYTSNSLPVNFDIANINLQIKQDTNQEVLELKKKVKELEEVIFNIKANKVFTTINAVNLKEAQPGMIPTLANTNGVYVLKHPFSNIVECVNGVYPEGGSLDITADDIYYNNKVLAEYLKESNSALMSLVSYIDSLKEEIKAINNKLIALEVKLEKHIANPII